MLLLTIVSFLWAFSFGLIGSRLAGLDSNFVTTIRLSLACLCFLPFLRLRSTSWAERGQLFALGALQFGLMYVAYIRAYAFLPSHLVALFSVLTPLYIVVAHQIGRRSLRWQLLVCALLSIAGAAVIKFSQPEGSFWIGFGLMQVSNVAFGLGQLLYRNWKLKRADRSDQDVFAWMYAGGAALGGVAALTFGDPARMHPTAEQWGVIGYLGVVASGLGFFLWNKGATRTNPAVLAAFNNAVVPLAMLLSLFGFGEAKDFSLETFAQLSAGGLLIGFAIWLGTRLGTANARSSSPKSRTTFE